MLHPLASIFLALATAAPQAADTAGEASQASAAPVVARGPGGLEVRADELDSLLLERFGTTANGRELLELLLKTRLLDELAAEAGVGVRPNEIAARWQELDRRARAAGEEGLLAEIRERGLSVEEFREFLRLSIIQERLTRADLELPDDATVTGAQQEVWLQQAIRERGLERYPPPWPDGIVARCGSLTVDASELARFLRSRLAPQKVHETIWHMLLVQALERRMPDLSAEARAAALEDELERRRATHARENPAISFEQRLGATGQTLAGLKRDPSLAIAALTRLWVDRKHGDDGLRGTYEEERAFFEGRHGRAVRARLLLLVAGRFVNEVVPRTFEEAGERLGDLKRRAGDEADFRALVAELSEDPGARKTGGDLGWVTRGDPRIPEPVRAALFDSLEEGGGLPIGGVAIGPVRLASGCALLWASAERPSPPWEHMAELVHEELRRRLIEELMPPEEVELVEVRR